MNIARILATLGAAVILGGCVYATPYYGVRSASGTIGIAVPDVYYGGGPYGYTIGVYPYSYWSAGDAWLGWGYYGYGHDHYWHDHDHDDHGWGRGGWHDHGGHDHGGHDRSWHGGNVPGHGGSRPGRWPMH